MATETAAAAPHCRRPIVTDAEFLAPYTAVVGASEGDPLYPGMSVDYIAALGEHGKSLEDVVKMGGFRPGYSEWKLEDDLRRLGFDVKKRECFTLQRNYWGFYDAFYKALESLTEAKERIAELEAKKQDAAP